MCGFCDLFYGTIIEELEWEAAMSEEEEVELCEVMEPSVEKDPTDKWSDGAYRAADRRYKEMSKDDSKSLLGKMERPLKPPSAKRENRVE